MSATSYDAFPYPSSAYPRTHPDRLAVMATLYGIDPAPVERCRVLELGCGDGWNLISMAYGLPGGEFTGIDLASTPIERGIAFCQELGLRNVHLRQLDLLEAGDLGEFDYIIAHGLYSWVPEPVRRKILEVCARSLARNGVALISYNVYPGNHLRELVRGMMHYHAAHFVRPEEKIRQSRALVRFLADSQEPRELYHHLLDQEAKRLENYSDGALFHDDLNPLNQPFYFHEFMAQAAPHGFQFLAEAEVSDNFARHYSPRAEAALAELDPNDLVAHEQYLDFLRCRGFRHTLLCRQDQPRQKEMSPERVMLLRIAGEIRPATADADPRSLTPEIFHGPEGSQIETNDPVLKAALVHLGTLWPECISFSDLLEHAITVSGAPSDPESRSRAAESLAAELLQLLGAAFLEFRAHRLPVVRQPGATPRISALARLQLRVVHFVTSLRQSTVVMDDPLGHALARLLDGSRDRAMLKAELASEAAESGFTVTDEALETSLHKFARAALLEG
ncbi:Methyltransferase type 12 [Chthoniobacter flavus Ellin428]|uniref:Methyltransferase type 12 n=1 Tax=Chthoniobacter flavus Ellin428 TaxID=497964 RepID=B4D7G5_9BACT|nr:class I SAM-dependent methyltransferase [Chthoniobacter flavus]EDY17582.1 Methyltransferase type 12 [Chthoniobacter flavus Ellin428]TCO92387.1 methyltransferase-like protein [Chthoniobacter flavus]